MGQRDLMNEWILERVSGNPADFAGADHIIINSAKERESTLLEKAIQTDTN